ncbi:hypothetical protein EV368DRAFT_78489 [Lentinula lateritia]|nr:hypothetical protein EV368DRAFT_78489 [Lentinula lateritia]
MLALAKEFADYTYLALPDLGTGTRHPLPQVHSITRKTPVNIREVGLSHQALVRASFAKLILLYLDTHDFLLADSTSNMYVPVRAKIDANKTLRQFAEGLENSAHSTEHVTLDYVRQILSLPENQDPLPVLYTWVQEESTVNVKCPIMLEAQVQDGNQLILYLRCDSTVMSLDTAKIFLEQLCATVAFICAYPSASCNIALDLPMHVSSALEAPYDPDEAELTCSWLTRNASLRPDAIAHEIYSSVNSVPEMLTYASLNGQSNRLARWLVSRGLQREDKIAVCRARDKYFYIAHAGIFKVGGCYVSIDPELPEERKKYIANDSGSKFVLTSADQAPYFGELAVVLDDLAVQEEVLGHDAADICLAELDSLAYLLYTSGTTGTPKGCLLNHRGLYWAIIAMCKLPSKVTNPDTDKRLALASIAFDVHISEICQSWCLGIRLVSGPRYEFLANLQENIINIGITHLGMVPSMIEATLSSPDDLPLKYLVSGGEKISDGLLRKWATSPKLILANFYGPTEATIGCTSRHITINDRKENIGRPFTSCQAYVVDSAMNIVPRGTPGELVVEGPLVGVGYHKLPDATNRVFLEWPRPGCRCYLRLMPDDTLEIMGRIDTQIKLRGVRIESEGVSNVILKASPIPMDATTLVSLHPGLGSAEVLVSFVAVLHPNITFFQRRSELPVVTDEAFTNSDTLQNMRDAAIRELAVYMRPSYIIPLNFLPLNMNGKTDNKILSALFKEIPLQDLIRLQGQAFAQITSEPTSEEAQVIEVVSRVTGLEPGHFNQFSNLFESGLDSLKFPVLASELRKTFMTSVTVAELMRRPVIRDVARLIPQNDPDYPRGDQTNIVNDFAEKWKSVVDGIFEPSSIQAVLPPFPVQEGILFRCIASPHLTCFIFDETLLQVVLHDGVNPLPWQFSDYEDKESSNFRDWFLRDQASHVSTRINEDFTTPMFAIGIYRNSSDKEVYMVISINHALYDGFSMPLLVREFRQCYLGEELPEPVPLVQMLHPILCQNKEDMRAFWISQFEDVDLQARAIRHPSSISPPTFLSHALDVPLSDIQAKSRSLHITLQALFCVVFAISGQSLFGWNNDAIFGVLRAGRSLAAHGTESAICPLVSVIPATVNLSPKLPWSNLLERSQSFVSESIQHEQVALGQIQRWLGVTELVDVLFSCRFDTGEQVSDVIEHIGTSRSSPEFIFAAEFLLQPIDDAIEVRVSFTEPEITPAGVLSFFARLDQVLENVLSHSNNITCDSIIDQPVVENAQTANLLDESSTSVELESVLQKYISEFLGLKLPALRPTTSFTSLGLSSIKAVSLSRVLLQHGINVSPVDIIQGDQIRAIAKRVHASTSFNDAPESTEWLNDMKERLANELNVERLKFEPKDEIVITGCTSLQTGMLAQTINSRGLLYIHAFTLQLAFDCDVPRLRAAWYEAVQTLTILRTSFHFTPISGQWAQVTHSITDFKWSQSTQDELGSAAADFITALAFDNEETFARPPVYFRHVSADMEYLVVVLHHALYDGLSLPKLFHHVQQLYQSKPVDVSTPFNQVADTILVAESNGTAFWTRRLESVKPYHFMVQSRSFEEAWRASTTLDITTAEIQRFCRRYHVHPQTLGQATWAKILCMRGIRSDVIFGQVVSGRSLSGADNVIGPVFNTIPCRVSLIKGQSNQKLVRDIHRSNNDGLPWQHASLRSIQQQLKFGSLFDTLYLFQPHVGLTHENPLWHLITRQDMQEGKTQYAVNIELHEGDTSYRVFASCSSDAMSQTELVSLLAQFNLFFAEIVRAPNAIALQDQTQIFSHPINVSVSMSPTSLDASGDLEAAIKLWSPTQQQLWKILIDFTGLPSDAIRPSTFLISIGIDSICAIQVASLARRSGIPLAATDVARSPTVQDLLFLDLVTNKGVVTQSKPILLELSPELVRNTLARLPIGYQRKISRLLPLAAGMEWTLSAWQTNHAVFPFELDRNNEAIDAVSSRLHNAWQKLIRQHEILRSVLIHTEEQTYRVLLGIVSMEEFEVPWEEDTLPSHDLLSNKTELELVKKKSKELAVMPISFGQPLIQLVLLHGKQSSYIIIGLHHMQYDGWSLPLLMRDLEALYTSRQPLSKNDLSSFLTMFTRAPEFLLEQEVYWKHAFPLTFHPHLFPYLNRHKVLDETTNSNISFISSLIRSVSSLRNLFSLGWARNRRRITEGQGDTDAPLHVRRGRDRTFINITIPNDILPLDILQSKARSYSLSLQSILLACWAIVQMNWSSSSDGATFLLSHAGRSSATIPNLDVLAVPCCNYAPVRVTLGIKPAGALKISAMTILDVARRIQADLTNRTPVVEQTRVADISKWIGLKGKPFCNVAVNVLRLPGGHSLKDAETPERLLKAIKFPYSSMPLQMFPGDPFFPEIQHDCLVEIYFSTTSTSHAQLSSSVLGLSIECHADLLSKEQAGKVVEDWKDLVWMFGALESE